MSNLTPDRAEGAPITIRERTGRKRSIVLSSRASAFRGSVKFAVGQRSKVTWYVGNPEGTQQLFGPSFDFPTNLVGVWRDRYLGAVDPSETPLVTVVGFAVPKTAEDLEACFKDLLITGSDLVVDYAQWRRVGILKQFTATPDRPEDVHWEAEFQWRGDGFTTAPRPKFGATVFEPARISRAMEALTDHSVYNPIDTLVAFEAKIFQAIADLQDQVNSLIDQGRTLAQLLTLPARLVQQVRAAATTIAFGVGQLIEEVVGSGYTTAQVTDDTASVLKASAWRYEAAYLAAELRASALDAAQALEDRKAPSDVRVELVDGSGSLRALAARVYGQADAWTVLADANGFDGPFVPPGTQIFVPPARASSLSTAQG